MVDTLTLTLVRYNQEKVKLSRTISGATITSTIPTSATADNKQGVFEKFEGYCTDVVQLDAVYIHAPETRHVQM